MLKLSDVQFDAVHIKFAATTSTTSHFSSSLSPLRSTWVALARVAAFLSLIRSIKVGQLGVYLFFSSSAGEHVYLAIQNVVTFHNHNRPLPTDRPTIASCRVNPPRPPRPQSWTAPSSSSIVHLMARYRAHHRAGPTRLSMLTTLRRRSIRTRPSRATHRNAIPRARGREPRMLHFTLLASKLQPHREYLLS